MKKRASRPRVHSRLTPEDGILVNVTHLMPIDKDLTFGTLLARSHGTQRIKETMRAQPKWSSLADDQKEALEMIAHKIGRVLCGDPDYADSWHDIAGYAKLVEDRLVADEKASQP